MKNQLLSLVGTVILMLTACQHPESPANDSQPLPAASEGTDRLVAKAGSQGEVVHLITVQEEAAILESGTGVGGYTDVTIKTTTDRKYFLTGHTQLVNAAIELFPGAGGGLYLRAIFSAKTCKGNPCTCCSFNSDFTGCNCCESQGKCDYSDKKPGEDGNH